MDRIEQFFKQKSKPKPRAETPPTYGDVIGALKIPLVLWLCRITCFIYVYMYHDWQSVVILVWIIHSTFFKVRNYFVEWTLRVYLPFMILNFLFMYTINLFGLINYFEWANEAHKIVNMYRYGFY